MSGFFVGMNWCVYILFSEKLNRFYTGMTGDLEQRIHFHQNAPGHKFTGKADDWRLFFKLECSSKSQALSIEKHIKRMKSAAYINNLAKYPEMVEKLKLKYPSEDC